MTAVNVKERTWLDEVLDNFVGRPKSELIANVMRMTSMSKDFTPEQYAKADEILKTRKVIVALGATFPSQTDQAGPPLIKATPRLESNEPTSGECILHLVPSEDARRTMEKAIAGEMRCYPYRQAAFRVNVNLMIGTVDEIISQFSASLRRAARTMAASDVSGTHDKVEEWNKKVAEYYPAPDPEMFGSYALVQEGHPKVREVRKLQAACMDVMDATREKPNAG